MHFTTFVSSFDSNAFCFEVVFVLTCFGFVDVTLVIYSVSAADL